MSNEKNKAVLDGIETYAGTSPHQVDTFIHCTKRILNCHPDDDKTAWEWILHLALNENNEIRKALSEPDEEAVGVEAELKRFDIHQELHNLIETVYDDKFYGTSTPSGKPYDPDVGIEKQKQKIISEWVNRTAEYIDQALKREAATVDVEAALKEWVIKAQRNPNDYTQLWVNAGTDFVRFLTKRKAQGHLQPAEAEWQPIETAPRDEYVLRLRCTGEVDFGNAYNIFGHLLSMFTHWMPLPKPP